MHPFWVAHSDIISQLKMSDSHLLESGGCVESTRAHIVRWSCRCQRALGKNHSVELRMSNERYEKLVTALLAFHLAAQTVKSNFCVEICEHVSPSVKQFHGAPHKLSLFSADVNWHINFVSKQRALGLQGLHTCYRRFGVSLLVCLFI